MPTAANIGFLLLLLQDEGNLRKALMRLEEAVDVDRPEAARKGDMVLLGQRLAAEEDDAVIGIGLTHRIEVSGRQMADIDAGNLRAGAGKRCDLHGSSLPAFV